MSFVSTLVHRIIGLASPKLRRHASPPSAVPRRLRRSWRSLWCSPCAAECSGATPVLNGAPKRLIRGVPPLAIAAGLAPPPTARARPGPSDPRSTVQIRWTLRVKPVCTGQPAPALDLSRRISIQRIRSTPSALPARFCLRNPEFFQNYNPVLPS
jgi:hypothetical protein